MPPDSLLPVFLLRLLTLGGYGLGLHHCRGCGQVPQPPLVVSLPRGGVVCRTCSQGGPGPQVSLNPGALKLLCLAQDLPLEKLGRLRLPPDQRGQSQGLLRLFIRHHLAGTSRPGLFGIKWPVPPDNGALSG